MVLKFFKDFLVFGGFAAPSAPDSSRVGFGLLGNLSILLTSLGGGAFGNNERWISAAMRRAREVVSEIDLDVKLVSYGAPSHAFLQMAKQFG